MRVSLPQILHGTAKVGPRCLCSFVSCGRCRRGVRGVARDRFLPGTWAASLWAKAVLKDRGVEGVRVLQGLLHLADRHACPAIDEACALALTHASYRLRTIRQLLKRDAPRQQVLDFMHEHAIIRGLESYGQFVHEAFQREANCMMLPMNLSMVARLSAPRHPCQDFAASMRRPGGLIAAPLDPLLAFLRLRGPGTRPHRCLLCDPAVTRHLILAANNAGVMLGRWHSLLSLWEVLGHEWDRLRTALRQLSPVRTHRQFGRSAPPRLKATT